MQTLRLAGCTVTDAGFGVVAKHCTSLKTVEVLDTDTLTTASMSLIAAGCDVKVVSRGTDWSDGDSDGEELSPEAKAAAKAARPAGERRASRTNRLASSAEMEELRYEAAAGGSYHSAAAEDSAAAAAAASAAAAAGAVPQ